MVALPMLEEVLLATVSMIVSCTSFPAAAAAPNVYVPLKSLAGAANALNVSANNMTAEIRRDVRAGNMVPPAASAIAETGQMKALLKLRLGMGARKGLSISYPDTSCCDTCIAILNINGIKRSLEMN
jgi:hypothetical protein